jgi:hypothetical protein
MFPTTRVKALTDVDWVVISRQKTIVRAFSIVFLFLKKVGEYLIFRR